MATIPEPPPPPPVPRQFTLPPDLLEEDEFTEKRFQKELQFHVVSAIEKGDASLVQELIHKGLNTNCIIQLVKTPLIHAIEQVKEIILDTESDGEICSMYISVVAALVNAVGTDLNLSENTPWGKRPLHAVAETGVVEVASLILESHYRCDVNGLDKGKATPLHYAAFYGHRNLVEYLLKHGSNVNAADDCGRTALHRACEQQKLDVAKVLIEHGAKVDAADKFLWTPIFNAVLFGHVSVAEFLVKHGAAVQRHDGSGLSLLYIACVNSMSLKYDYPLTIKICLATTFDVVQRHKHIASSELRTFILHNLDYKIMYDDLGMFEMVKLLINTGVDAKAYPTDDIYCEEYSVMGKTQGYLLLCGAMLPYDDVLFNINDDKNQTTWRANWFRRQKNLQLSLQRQCRYAIRRVLAGTRDIDSAINCLPGPDKLKNLIRPDEEFEEFLTIEEDGGAYVETLSPEFVNV